MWQSSRKTGITIEQPRTDGGPARQANACQHRRGWGLAGPHRGRQTKQKFCHKIQRLQLHVPRGCTAQYSGRVEQERENTSRGSNNGEWSSCHAQCGHNSNPFADALTNVPNVARQVRHMLCVWLQVQGSHQNQSTWSACAVSKNVGGALSM